MNRTVHPRFVPLPYQDARESGRLILRDGTTAHVRPARPEDRPSLDDFFHRLSPDSRRWRFLSVFPPLPELTGRLVAESDPHAALTLVVVRTYDGLPRVIACAAKSPCRLLRSCSSWSC
ncbi:MAG TPA: hypothetical protein VGJ05_13675 [Fimbriiglobus sp.]|jgi:hypothetical protein